MKQENNAAVDIIKQAKLLLDRAYRLNHEDMGFDVDVVELQENIENYLNDIEKEESKPNRKIPDSDIKYFKNNKTK